METPSARSIIRRTATLLFALSLVVAARPLSPIGAQAATNPVVTENQQPGSGGWQLGTLVSDDVTGQIKGYGSANSVLQGQALSLFVTVNPVQTYSIDVYRIGWYAGIGGRQRLHVGPLAGVHQQTCVPDPTTGLNACTWTPSYTLTIPADWTSGMYFAVLTNAAGYQNIIPFVVRDGRPAALLYQQSVNTDEAYNNYPNDQLTGKSLYDYNSYGATTSSGGVRAAKVSFDRPWTGYGVGQFTTWELDMVRWLEKSGYDVTYSTDVDTHANGAELKNHRGFLVNGHDKFWSKEMRDAAEAARDFGVNLAFFGSDDASMQARYEASATGVPNRLLVCYRDATKDPVQGPTTTVEFRTPQVNRPEQTLLGVQWTSQTPYGTTVDYIVNNSTNWVYAGTGLHDNDHVTGIVGYEMDRFMAEYPAPNALSRTILSQSPFTAWPTNAADYANSSIYQAPSGAWVFAAGTMSWAWGLDNFNHSGNYADARIQQITTTVLDRFVNVPPPALQVTGVQATNITPTSADVMWRTNNTANSRIDYGLAATYGSTVSDPSLVVNHALHLSGLTASTTYHYQVTSVDGANQSASSTDATFTTTAAPNLITNPGFESGTTGWGMNTFASIDTTPANAHSGNNSLKLTTMLAWQGTWGSVAVTPGKSYTISGWERSTSSSGYITLVSYDANWIQLSTGPSLIFAGTGSWTTLSGTYVAPLGAAYVQVGLQSDGAGTFWFDDLSLTQP